MSESRNVALDTWNAVLESDDVDAASKHIEDWARKGVQEGSPYHQFGMKMAADMFDRYMASNYHSSERNAMRDRFLSSFSDAVVSKNKIGPRSEPEFTGDVVSKRLHALQPPKPTISVDNGKPVSTSSSSPAGKKAEITSSDVSNAASRPVSKNQEVADAEAAMRVRAIQNGTANVEGAIGESQRNYLHSNNMQTAGEFTSQMNDWRKQYWAERGVTGYSKNPVIHSAGEAYAYPKDANLTEQQAQDAYALRLLQRGDITADQMPLYSNAHAIRTPAGLKDSNGNYVPSNAEHNYTFDALKDTGFFDTRQLTRERAYDSQQALDNARLQEMIAGNRAREEREGRLAEIRKRNAEIERNSVHSYDGHPLTSGSMNAMNYPLPQIRVPENTGGAEIERNNRSRILFGGPANVSASSLSPVEGSDSIFTSSEEPSIDVDSAIHGILNPPFKPSGDGIVRPTVSRRDIYSPEANTINKMNYLLGPNGPRMLTGAPDGRTSQRPYEGLMTEIPRNASRPINKRQYPIR
jgi:hypothetical protein